MMFTPLVNIIIIINIIIMKGRANAKIIKVDEYNYRLTHRLFHCKFLCT